jgi:hypothetical protein
MHTSSANAKQSTALALHIMLHPAWHVLVAPLPFVFADAAMVVAAPDAPATTLEATFSWYGGNSC